MRGSQLFAPSVLGLGEAETPITADKRLRGVYPALAGLCPNPARWGFFYLQYLSENSEHYIIKQGTMKDKNLNYGGVTWHVFVNLLLGIILLVIAIYGGLTFHPIIYLLFLPVPYFVLKAIKWRAGGFLEERLRIREELIKLVQPKEGDRVLDVGTGGGLLAIGFAKAAKDVKATGIDLWVPGEVEHPSRQQKGTRK